MLAPLCMHAVASSLVGSREISRKCGGWIHGDQKQWMDGCLVESEGSHNQHLELEAWPWTNPSLCVPRWIRNRIAVKDDRADPYPLFGGTLKAPSLVPNALTLALDPAVRAPYYRMGWRYNVR
jgi:hypothetical protein